MNKGVPPSLYMSLNSHVEYSQVSQSTMHFLHSFSILCALSSLAIALPTADNAVQRDSSLRLIKTSEQDPGVWVTDEEKIATYVSKRIKFIDVTDITVSGSFGNHYGLLGNRYASKG